MTTNKKIAGKVKCLFGVHTYGLHVYFKQPWHYNCLYCLHSKVVVDNQIVHEYIRGPHRTGDGGPG